MEELTAQIDSFAHHENEEVSALKGHLERQFNTKSEKDITLYSNRTVIGKLHLYTMGAQHWN